VIYRLDQSRFLRRRLSAMASIVSVGEAAGGNGNAIPQVHRHLIYHRKEIVRRPASESL
jgi:hypothetical protein